MIIKGDPGNNVAAMFGEGAEKILKSNKDINIVYDQFMANWDQKGAEAVAENQLSAHNDDIAAFVTSNDGMGQGVAQAVIGRKLAGKVFISGLDADTASLQTDRAGRADDDGLDRPRRGGPRRDPRRNRARQGADARSFGGDRR